MVWGQTLRLKMVKGCCVFDCSTNVKSHPNLSFYILPADPKRRRLWLNAIYRIDSSCKNKLWSPNTKHVYVCSKHFVSVSMLGVKKSIVESSHRQNRLLSRDEWRINRLNSSLGI
ncbi:THAP domain-containing protein 2-like [Hydra vulgaris]|uniref:THAP domain-containing protein 2-like n=1 Tax=Hydra vulgaris TaxID=6087 RepID=A0ABM4B0M9_HYDVU